MVFQFVSAIVVIFVFNEHVSALTQFRSRSLYTATHTHIGHRVPSIEYIWYYFGMQCVVFVLFIFFLLLLLYFSNFNGPSNLRLAFFYFVVCIWNLKIGSEIRILNTEHPIQCSSQCSDVPLNGHFCTAKAYYIYVIGYNLLWKKERKKTGLEILFLRIYW